MSFLLRRTAAAAAAPASAPARRAFSTTSRLGLARVNLIGYLAESPELHSTSSGREIVRYTLATSTGGRDTRKTSWWKVTSFVEGGSRDYLMNLPKGSRLFVDGDISTNSYTDPNGVQRIGVSVVQRTWNPPP